MEIGKALKHFRTIKNLRQVDFVHGVVSVPFYSKVEHGEHRISAEDLFEILSKNEIPIETFMNLVASYQVEDHEAQMRQLIYQHFYNGDIKALKKLLKDTQNTSLPTPTLWIAQLKTTIANLEGTFTQLEQIEIHLIYEEIIRIESWTPYSLMLFANTLYLFPFERATLLIQTILRPKTLQRLNKDNRSKQIILTICLNYIALCIKHQKKSEIKQPLQVLRDAPNLPELFFYKVMALFYETLLQSDSSNGTNQINHVNHGDSDNIKMITDLFQRVNMSPFAKSLLQYYENYIEESIH